MFQYLVNECPFAKGYWSYKLLLKAYKQCLSVKWVEGITAIVAGSTLSDLFRSFTVKGRLQILEEVFEPLIKVKDLAVLKTTTGT